MCSKGGGISNGEHHVLRCAHLFRADQHSRAAFSARGGEKKKTLKTNEGKKNRSAAFLRCEHNSSYTKLRRRRGNAIRQTSKVDSKQRRDWSDDVGSWVMGARLSLEGKQ